MVASSHQSSVIDTKSTAELAQRCSVSLVDLLTGRVTYTRNGNGSGAAYDAFALQPRSFIAAGDASGALATDGAPAKWQCAFYIDSMHAVANVPDASRALAI